MFSNIHIGSQKMIGNLGQDINIRNHLYCRILPFNLLKRIASIMAKVILGFLPKDSASKSCTREVLIILETGLKHRWMRVRCVKKIQ